jgi:dimethylhistidine N-methyltransferase
MPPKHLYDPVGCALFERICALPEYYPTRAERALLIAHADAIAAATGARALIELGSGSGEKTAVLLRALARRGGAIEYAPIDIAEGAVLAAAANARRAVPAPSGGVRVRGFVGDFTRDLGLLPLLPTGPTRLFAFLGGTIGNFDEAEATALLSAIASRMREGDALLLGLDLVKPIDRLLRAYDDAAGVTAAFDRNLLSVLDRAARGRLRPRALRARGALERGGGADRDAPARDLGAGGPARGDRPAHRAGRGRDHPDRDQPQIHARSGGRDARADRARGPALARRRRLRARARDARRPRARRRRLRRCLRTERPSPAIDARGGTSCP